VVDAAHAHKSRIALGGLRGGPNATLSFQSVAAHPPAPVRLGTTVTFTKAGVSSTKMQHISLRDEVSYSIFGKQRQLWNLSIDPCTAPFKEIECPLVPGAFAFQINVTLPRLLPAGEFVDLQLYSMGDGQPAGCVKFSFNTTR